MTKTTDLTETESVYLSSGNEKEEKKLYILQQGEYLEQGIIGVYSSMDMVDQAVSRHENGERLSVSIVIVDKDIVESAGGRIPYVVSFEYRGEHMQNVTVEKADSSAFRQSITVTKHNDSKARFMWPDSDVKICIWSFEDEADIVRVAERRFRSEFRGRFINHLSKGQSNVIDLSHPRDCHPTSCT